VQQKAASKIDVYTDAPLSLVSGKASGSMSVSLEKRKKQAEEPIYLKRM
jgi:hypothetical protein